MEFNQTKNILKILHSIKKKKHFQNTRFSKDPALVKGVDEEDGRLRDGHEEVADCQVHDEKVGGRPQLLVTEIKLGEKEGDRRLNTDFTV